MTGKNINAGTVSVLVAGDDLVETYNTDGDWEQVETHLWVCNAGNVTQPETGWAEELSNGKERPL